MTEPVVLVAGATGRVGRPVSERLQVLGLAVAHLTRADLEALVEHSADALDRICLRYQGAIGVLNLAGRAHVTGRVDVPDLSRANIEVPLALHRLSTALRVPLVHLSSTKARDLTARSNTYATSKAIAEHLLEMESAAPNSAQVVAVRTCAVLAGPFDAGKLSLLKRLSWVPSKMVPTRTIPVIAPNTLADVLFEELTHLTDARYRVVQLELGRMMTLRSVLRMLASDRDGYER